MHGIKNPKRVKQLVSGFRIKNLLPILFVFTDTTQFFNFLLEFSINRKLLQEIPGSLDEMRIFFAKQEEKFVVICLNI